MNKNPMSPSVFRMRKKRSAGKLSFDFQSSKIAKITNRETKSFVYDDTLVPIGKFFGLHQWIKPGDQSTQSVK